MNTRMDKTLNRILRRHPKLLEWHFTPWRMDGHGSWKEQPIILIEGEAPFFADHPQVYIDKLEEMSRDPRLIKGAFHALSGQLKDALEQGWAVSRRRK